MNFLEQISTIAGVASLPLLIVGYVDLYTKWGAHLRKFQKPIGFALLGLAVVAYSLDLADRFGAFGPTKSELFQTVQQLKGQIAELRAPISRKEIERRSLLVESLRAEYFKSHGTQYPTTYNQVVAWINAQLEERGEAFKIVANSLAIGDAKFPSSGLPASSDGDCPAGAAVCLSGNVPNAEVDCIRSNGANARGLVVHSGPKNLKSRDVQTNSKQPCPR